MSVFPDNLADDIRSAIAEFDERQHRPPEVIAIAPGRINLIGEHTDYNDGLVLPMTIDRHIVLAATRATGRYTSLASPAYGHTITCDLTDAGARPGSWANGIIGVAAQFAADGATIPPLDIVVQSTLPIGAGLGSSAALEAAMSRLLDHVCETTTPALEAARRCQAAENVFAGTPCGIMDMLVALAGSPADALLIDCETNLITTVPLPDESDAIIAIMSTGVRHDLATSAYSTRRTTCEQAARSLGVPSLRHATLDQVERSTLAPAARRRARHVVAEIERTRHAVKALRAGDLETLGVLMNESHASLRDDFEVSCDELDCLVETAQSIGADAGVYGARMTGGGFGGCAIALCHPDAFDTLSRTADEAFTARFDRQPEIWRARPTEAARAFDAGVTR